ncbi:hypothetical protein F5Y18DRAFT_385703 [Xylariaceae sp. FL1019]|nr:hypothetical protein F5Y18DRAFT_385703 [Xylariaceae sp. FL1019]
MATTIFDASKSSSVSRLSGPHVNMANPVRHVPATPSQTPPPALQVSEAQSPNKGSPENAPAPDGHYRKMTKTEWLQFCHGIGVLKDEESAVVLRASNRVWPPSGFRDGLYGDILFEKSKFTYWFHILSTIRWVLMLAQIALSAVLTAFGATSSKTFGTAITTIAAANTAIAGILALMHNSGLPDRYRSDRNEFYKLEEHIKAIVDTGLIPAGNNVNDVLAQCWVCFQTALQSVQNNVPAAYIPATAASAMPAGMSSGARGNTAPEPKSAETFKK